jgi:LmbE family N-acetylglucosaminyl deacetylase
MPRLWLGALLALLSFAALSAQPVYPYAYPKQDGAAELLEDLRRLRVFGTALYVAAHPDDENTRLIAWLDGARKVRTHYLSLTRGDGGQNLIGPEIRDLLGVLRTQELCMARGVDGGEQWFSRANDFGYSKHPEETMGIWDKESVLADVVWAIRRTRPDIIVNRFDHRSPGRTHGHHTASAMLALEAFELAGDPEAFPEQLAYVRPWQASRIFFNTSWWFYGSREAFAEADKSNMVAVDVGAYNSARGLSYTEIAARSRSQHKCQGFGSTGTRGEQMEYLEFLDGSPLPEEAGDPFADLPLDWSRIRGGSSVADALARAEAAFDPDQPERAVPALLEALAGMNRLLGEGPASAKQDGAAVSKAHALPVLKPNQDPRIRGHRDDCADLIRRCLGLWVEAVAERPMAVPGDALQVQLEVVQRRPLPKPVQGISLESLQILDARGQALALEGKSQLQLGLMTMPQKRIERNMAMTLPVDAAYSSPYWLLEEGSLGTFRVDRQDLRGLPETPPALRLRLDMELRGEALSVEVPVIYKQNDRVQGEVYQPFVLVPPASLQLDRSVQLLLGEASVALPVRVRAHRDGVQGRLFGRLPDGAPLRLEGDAAFSLESMDDETVLSLRVTPEEASGSGTFDLELFLELDGKVYPFALSTVAYDHIPEQTVLYPAQVRLARLDLEVSAKQIGYIMGAGDAVPEALEAIGCTVQILDDAFLNAPDLLQRLKRFDAVVAGVRAYNTRDRLPHAQQALMDYVAQGGTYLVQYNTNRGLENTELAPYPLRLSRDRVTVEEAPVEMLAPDHPALRRPNRIAEADFDGWVQERGLYFPDEWDEAYTPLLRSSDPAFGEADAQGSSRFSTEPLDGGLLVAQHGEGWYVYTGYSFFRELPAGVPGAFRLFANLISLGSQ